MEEKRGLSMDEMEKVSGGTGETYGIDTDGKNEKQRFLMKTSSIRHSLSVFQKITLFTAANAGVF